MKMKKTDRCSMARRFGIKKYTRVLREEGLKEKRGSMSQRKRKRYPDTGGDGHYRMKKNCSFYMPENNRKSNALDDYPKRWMTEPLPDPNKAQPTYDPRRDQFNSSSTSRTKIFHFRGGRREKRGKRPIVIDGSNVAVEHYMRNNINHFSKFSSRGIQISVDYFVKIHGYHASEIEVWVPRFRQEKCTNPEVRFFYCLKIYDFLST